MTEKNSSALRCARCGYQFSDDVWQTIWSHFANKHGITAVEMHADLIWPDETAERG